jgi:hypothetical protein
MNVVILEDVVHHRRVLIEGESRPVEKEGYKDRVVSSHF